MNLLTRSEDEDDLIAAAQANINFQAQGIFPPPPVQAAHPGELGNVHTPTKSHYGGFVTGYEGMNPPSSPPLQRKSKKEKREKTRDLSGIWMNQISKPYKYCFTMSDAEIALHFPLLLNYSTVEAIRHLPKQKAFDLNLNFGYKSKSPLHDNLVRNEGDVKKITMFAAKGDDRFQVLHPMTWVHVPLSSEIFLQTEFRRMYPHGLRLVASYDLNGSYLNGSISYRGWAEANNPSSTSIELKHFLRESATLQAKKVSELGTSIETDILSSKEYADVSNLKTFFLAFEGVRIATR